MSNLTLDGSTSFIGTEFIKLLATGSSNLATVQYVDDAIAEGGGGGAIDAYTKTEVDNLLNAKLNVSNPQDVIGTLRIDSTNGNGKLIVNAVGAPNDEDFYVNGLSNLGGTLKCQLLQASSNIETSQLIRSDTINTYSNTDMKIQRNSIDYIVLESDKVNFTKDIYVNDVLLTGGVNPFGENVVINNPYELQCNTFNNSVLNQDMVFNINDGEWFRLQLSDNTVRVPNTKSFVSQNIYSDILRPLAFGNDVVFYGGNAGNSAYVEYFENNRATETVDFNKGIKCNEFNSNGDTDVVFKQNNIEFIRLKTNGNMEIKRLCSFISTLALDVSGALSIFRNPAGGIETIDIKNNYGTGRHRFIIANNTILEMTTNLIKATRILECDAGIKTNTINTATDTVLAIQRNSVEYLRLDTALDNIVCSKGIVAGGGIDCNTLDSDGDSNVLFKRNNSTYMTFNTDRVDINQELHLANALIIDTADKLTMRPSLEGGINIFDTVLEIYIKLLIIQ